MKLKKELPWFYYIVFTWIFFFLLASICAVAARQAMGYGFRFSLYQIFAILIPGLAYQKLLQSDENTDSVKCLFFGYALGYCSNIIIYYLLFLLGGMESNAFAYLICLGIQCIIAVLYLQREKVTYNRQIDNWYIPLFFILSLFLIELFTYAGYNMLPPYTDGDNIWKDVRYWIGDTVSLKINYPPVNFRNLSSNYTYHFFSSMQLAVESIVTGIPVAELNIYFSFIQSIFIVVGGSYCLIQKCIKGRGVMFLSTVVLLFTSGYEGITRASYVSHMYMSQYGFDYGIGFMLFLLAIMVDFYDKNFSWKNYFTMGILFAVLMGIKSPFACIAIVGIGSLCLLFLFQKNWKKALPPGLTILTVFVFIYIYICNMEGYASGGISSVIDLNLHHWDVSENLNNLRNNVFQVEWIPDVVLEVFFAALFIMICHPCLYLGVFVFGLIKIVKCKKFTWFDISCILMMLTGLLFALYIHMSGKSNTYFAMATYPVAWLFIVRSIGEISDNKNSWSIPILGIMILIGGNLFLNHSAYEPITFFWERGKDNLLTADRMMNDTSEFGLSSQEYEILQWAKDNVDASEFLISINNRTGDRNLAGIFSEHRILNVLCQNVVSDEVDLKEVMEKNGINHVILPKEVLNSVGVPNKVLWENEKWMIVLF